MPPGWTPWQFIAVHSYEHYREHTPALRAWLDTTAPDADQTPRCLVTAGAPTARRAVTPALSGSALETNMTRWEEEGGRV
jgi:hypothetical protein